MASLVPFPKSRASVSSVVSSCSTWNLFLRPAMKVAWVVWFFSKLMLYFVQPVASFQFQLNDTEVVNLVFCPMGGNSQVALCILHVHLDVLGLEGCYYYPWTMHFLNLSMIFLKAWSLHLPSALHSRLHVLSTEREFIVVNAATLLNSGASMLTLVLPSMLHTWSWHSLYW